ncbi:MAG: nuclear transport factor 2 family protein, partial [Steroidobacteraceae bacterium]
MASTDVSSRLQPPQAAPDQAALLHSPDPRLAANKRLVFDMWRAIIQAGHTELAPQYFTLDYIQHNPNVASGRDALVEYMRATRPVRPIEPRITFPV